MSVANAIYKVGDTYTSQKSKATGVIKEIVPQANGNVRVKLDVNGSTRWTTWTAKALAQWLKVLSMTTKTAQLNTPINYTKRKGNQTKWQEAKQYR